MLSSYAARVAGWQRLGPSDEKLARLPHPQGPTPRSPEVGPPDVVQGRRVGGARGGPDDLRLAPARPQGIVSDAQPL